jgi:VPDSG-CTERM motif
MSNQLRPNMKRKKGPWHESRYTLYPATLDPAIMKTPSKITLTLLVISLVSCGFFSQQAQAVPIVGGISLAGSYTVNTGNLNTATAFTSFPFALVTGVSGSYTGVGVGLSSPSVTMTPFSFNPFSSSVTPLWTFMSAGNTYSFDLTALTSVLQPGDNTLTLKGTGTLHITNFTNTVGSWVFTANQASDTFSFSSSNAAVPDSGSAVALLGIALAGIEGVRRALRTRAS